jgi:hypothetical protein
MRFKKQDRRNIGINDFKYKVTFVDSYEVDLFNEVRNWCWDQWGPSCELDFWYKAKPEFRNPVWCWLVDQHRTQIMFAEHEQAAWFKLKWL